jgi:hypothetical protein
MVFLEIKRRNEQVYYWKSNNGYEVDFVVKSGQKIPELIQVSCGSGFFPPTIASN